MATASSNSTGMSAVLQPVTSFSVSSSSAQMPYSTVQRLASTTQITILTNGQMSASIPQSTQMTASTLQTVKPLFLKDKDIGEGITPIQICDAIVRDVNPSKLEGVQKIHSIWRIYLKDMQTRLELSTKESIAINGRQVRIFDRNPNATFGGIYEQGQSISDKLTIRNLPLSVSNKETEKLLLDKNVKLRSSIKYGCIRDDNGQLTSYKNGDRFVYVEPYDTPLPKQQEIGQFKCLLIHHGKDIKCKACDVLGHRIGAEICKAKPKTTIYAFKGYHHPLSNHFPCKLSVYGKVFKSAEHAFFWRMASEMGKLDLAKDIQDAVHAGVAKKLSKSIAEEKVRWKWEDENLDVMKHILEVKFQQCEQFKECLLENHDNVLAEATPSLKWATGMSPWVTEHTAPEYWPGRNLLGALLSDLSQKLSGDHTGLDTQHPITSHAPAYSQVSSSESPSVKIDADPAESEATEEDNMSSSQDLNEDLTSSLQQGHTSAEIISQTTNQSDQACGHAQNSQDSQPNKVQDSDTSHRSKQRDSTKKPSRGPSTRRSASTSSIRGKKADSIMQNIRDAFEKGKGKRKKPSSSPDFKDGNEKLHKANLEIHK